MGELEERISQAVRSLARINLLTPEVIAHDKSIVDLSAWSSKRVLKATLHAAASHRSRGQYGRLRAAILIGVTLFGERFLLKAERSGMLLANNATERTFTEFLNHLSIDVSLASSPDWIALRGRLKTYLAYQKLVEAINSENGDVVRFLRDRPRRSIRMALVLTALAFLARYFDFRIPSTYSKLIDELGPPEYISSIASLLVVLSNEYQPLDSFDFASPGTEQEIAELRQLMVFGKAMVEQTEAGKYISLFRYELDTAAGRNWLFKLTPPFREFEYSLRLGFILYETNAGIARVDVASKGKDSALSLQVAAELFAQKFRGNLGDIKDPSTEWRRLRINVPVIPKLYSTIKNSLFYEDFLSAEQLAQDFLIPLSLMDATEIKVSHHLDLETFHNIWRYLQFVGLVDIALLREYSESDPTLFLKSLVRVVGEGSMAELVQNLGTSSAEAGEFLQIASADVRRLGYLDLQYRPFLRIAQTRIPNKNKVTKPEIIYLPALVCVSNVVRNVQSANKFRIEINARIFVEAVTRALKARFEKVASNRAVKGDGATDIDVVVLEEGTLYPFECKHSLPPTGPHEMRDVWEEIEKGIDQLETAMKILADPNRRQSYLTGWFPGTKLQGTAGLEIFPGVLCSHKIFSGLHYRGVPIRDFSSLNLLCRSGVIGMGGMVAEDEVVLRQYRIICDKTMSNRDLQDYMSPHSKYFKSFQPFMHPVTRIAHFGGLKIAKETYVYEVELDDWASQLESLGCTREPDRKQRLKAISKSEMAPAT